MEIKPIAQVKPSQISLFDCGNEELNFYLNRFAKKNDKLGIGKTYILEKNNKIQGYYTISMGQIEFNSFSATSQKGVPRYPIPVVRVGRLAVDKNCQRQGIGKFLLMDSLERAERVSSEIAVHAVIVDAKDEKAKEYYLQFGFTSLVDKSLTLFLQMSTIKQLTNIPVAAITDH